MYISNLPSRSVSKVFVDGLDVIHSAQQKVHQQVEPYTQLLNSLVAQLRDKTTQYRIIFDNQLQQVVADATVVAAILERKDVRLAPVNMKADQYLAHLSQVFDAPIITNNEYQDLRHVYPAVEQQLIPIRYSDGTFDLG